MLLFFSPFSDTRVMVEEENGPPFLFFFSRRFPPPQQGAGFPLSGKVEEYPLLPPFFSPSRPRLFDPVRLAGSFVVGGEGVLFPPFPPLPGGDFFLPFCARYGERSRALGEVRDLSLSSILRERFSPTKIENILIPLTKRKEGRMRSPFSSCFLPKCWLFRHFFHRRLKIFPQTPLPPPLFHRIFSPKIKVLSF